MNSGVIAASMQDSELQSKYTIHVINLWLGRPI
jgi:hypothetical protein